MALPTFDQFMLPVLRVLSRHESLTRRQIYSEVAKETQLGDDDLLEVVSSGEPKYQNRISWAMTDLRMAGALARPARATFGITDRGRALLSEGKPITRVRLREFPEYAEYISQWTRKAGGDAEAQATSSTPEQAVSPVEVISTALAQLRTAVEADLIDRLKSMDPYAFERLVLRVLEKMGYGKDGTLSVTQASNDKGVDCIISQDPLGLDRIYVQAKRWEGSIHAPDIHQFIGALISHQGDRGVFFTTSQFSAGAKEQAKASSLHIELIDGKRLAGLMVTHGVGVHAKPVEPIYHVDEDFFEDF